MPATRNAPDLENTMHAPDFSALFVTHPVIIGMIHLPALPGAPGHAGMTAVLDAARRDAHALTAGGVHGIMIENFGDVPFLPGPVAPETVAALTHAAVAVRSETDLPIGINILRNDARAAIGIAATVGAAFIRVNVHTGAMLTDQGWISGQAHDTVRARASLRCPAAILADVLVKHAVPPVGLDIVDAARDTVHRGLADALIVSGAATGSATDAARVRAVRQAVAVPVLVGSGIDEHNAGELLRVAHGAIVGSSLQHNGTAGGRVEVERVLRLMRVVHELQP
jgi:uncharacterized protein